MTNLETSVIDPVEIAAALIRCESVTPADGGALRVLEELLAPAGFRCERLAFSEPGTPDIDNLFARFGTGAPHFCFAGHTDVVPTGEVSSWSRPPFAADIRDGLLYGRGAVDMKGAVAAFVAAALRFAAEQGADFGGSISLLITGDEEGPAVNGTRKVLDWLAQAKALPDHCLVGEPTNPDRLGDVIKIGRRGSLTARLRVTGTQGHSAYPHLADNPVDKLVHILHRLISEPLDDGSAHFEPSTVALTSVDVGNDAANIIPAEARARFNIRFNDHHTAASLTERLHRTCAAVIDELGGAYDLEVTSSGDCFLTEPGPLVDVVAGAVEKVTGLKPALTTGGGTSDARFIKDHCPVVEFGLVGQTMHQIDERVAVDDLHLLAAVYGETLKAYFNRFAG